LSNNAIEKGAGAPVAEASTKRPTASEVYAQLEEQLNLAEQAPTVPFRMLAVAKAMALVFRWNQEQGGTPQTWDAEHDEEFRRKVLEQLLMATARNMTDFAAAVSVPNGEAAKSDQEVWQVALKTQPVKGRKGRPLRGGGTVAGNHMAVEFVNLLERAWGLTRDQLRFMADFARPQGAAAQHETSETINLLVKAGFVTAQDSDSWKNSQVELYTLNELGQNFHRLLHQRDASRPAAETGLLEGKAGAGLQELYGLNQVLASLAGTCKVATSSGKLADLLNQARRRPAWYYRGEERAGLRLDWEDWRYRLPSRDSSRFIWPGAVARLVVDDRQLVPALLSRANLSPDQPETRFVFSRVEDNAIWPFIVEYDWAADNPNYLTGKITSYIELFNTQRLWPEKWLGRFPVILVVSAGKPRHLLSLMMSVREQLWRSGRVRAPQEWWFTSTNWFATAYADYLGTFNNRRKARPAPSENAPLSHYLAQKGRIWLPISAMREDSSEDLDIGINGLNFLLLNEDPADKELVASNLSEVGLGNWIERLVALPLPHDLVYRS
jgi:hypothetical protein